MRALRRRRRRRPGDRRLSYALAVAVLAGLLLIGFGAANLVGAAQGGWSVLALGALIVAAGTLLLVVEPPLKRSAGSRDMAPAPGKNAGQHVPAASRPW